MKIGERKIKSYFNFFKKKFVSRIVKPIKRAFRKDRSFYSLKKKSIYFFKSIKWGLCLRACRVPNCLRKRVSIKEGYFFEETTVQESKKNGSGSFFEKMKQKMGGLLKGTLPPKKGEVFLEEEGKKKAKKK